MRIRLIILTIALTPLSNIEVYAQKDTIPILKNTIVPAALMTTGILLNKESIKTNIQKDIRNAFPDFDSRLDDYMMMAPTALDLLFTLTDNKSNNKKHLTDIVIGQIAIYATTKSLKKILNVERPNGGREAFPSGHTSQAFSGATLFFHHYKNENIWMASSAYVLATATGAFRVLNNRHWVSDVAFGAGLGILVGNLTYHFNPLGKENLGSQLNFTLSGNGFAFQWKF